MTIRCVDCSQFHLRSAKGMARLGFGHCGHVRSGAVFMSSSVSRECRYFAAAPDGEAKARAAWISRQIEALAEEVCRHA